MAVCLLGGVAVAAPVGTTVVLDKSAARVGDQVIWQRDVDARARPVPEADKAGVLDEMINEELVLLEAKRIGVTVEPSEVLAALDEVKKQNNLDDKGFEAALIEYGYTLPRYKVDLEKQLLRLRATYQIILPRIDLTDFDVEAEAKKRNMKVPLATNEKDQLRFEMRRKLMDAETVKWVAELRKRVWIEKRS
jgi:parvulin-like peptidyl-prolyl isomerase